MVILCQGQPEQMKWNEMNGVLGHGSVLYGYTGPGTTWANEMKSMVFKATILH